jgi:hypothetical protein
MRDFATGKLDQENPNALAMLNTAVSYYATPKAQYNPATGQFEQQNPVIPRQLQVWRLIGSAERGLPAPFANGGEVRKYQLGGAATSGGDWNRVNEMLNPSAAYDRARH